MGGFNKFPIAQQQESVSRTFYVLRETGMGFGFTKVTKVDYGCGLEFCSNPENTVDDATQFTTLADVVAAQVKTGRASGLHYEIVMVSRSVTKGVLKSPAKTVRRIVPDGEVVPFGAKWAVKNPYSDMGDEAPSMWDGLDNCPFGASLNARPALFTSFDELLLAAIKRGTTFPDITAPKTARWIVRVVEETVPEVRTEDVVKDILTPLP